MNYNKAEFERAFGISGQLPPSEVPEIAFAGRSNVGKSSLLNKLFNRKSLARVSSVPGKTITINFYDVDGYKFVDLPGYGYAKLSKSERDRFGELMEGYFQSGRNIKLVVQLVDMRHKPSQDDYGMIDFMQQMDIPFIVVCTKADKLKVKEFKRREKEIKEELSMVEENLIIPFSSQSGLGLDTVKMLIEKSLGA
ncbi:ribosome biogenesis GTP-binding protein YihA/YsxC [Eubacterium coprostanoligenes]|uniref:ribosome biogenesis GTP-binding protein YihA/YsxC n=1 Tax=Eubacterium coprostanoligenes TaxID=290054 RepID=UPI002357FAA6|nr:ribosome biogenesis GTP-binding protein YihA/YsxC [Eubacterium coprostanoligenes]MCI6254606.1 ribosome biogenesis GTP-binding protein YihA/YsxC [Eubacterium coprostanoligenes]MDY5400668.1 ribosome biogenesis GTP-binding protein YihA/YsxC [Eubacterium coprostanoligenes]